MIIYFSDNDKRLRWKIPSAKWWNTHYVYYHRDISSSLWTRIIIVILWSHIKCLEVLKWLSCAFNFFRSNYQTTASVHFSHWKLCLNSNSKIITITADHDNCIQCVSLRTFVSIWRPKQNEVRHFVTVGSIMWSFWLKYFQLPINFCYTGRICHLPY